MRNESQPSFIEKLKFRLSQPLPGETAQYKMAPTYRPRIDWETIHAQNPRIGGVMILLYEKQDEWFTVFTQRRKYEGVHSGQMSFPGGKKDDTDKDIIHTAVRETEEEVGIHQSSIEIVGALSKLYIPPSNFLVHPVIAHLHGDKQFKAQEREVEEIVEIPLSFFLDAGNVQETEIALQNNLNTKVPAFVYNKHIIWGATAIILSEFREVITEVQSL